MPIYTAGPWSQERISRSLIKVSAASGLLGLREMVALVDGERMQENADAICALPEAFGAILAGDLEAARAALTERGIG